MTDQNSQRRFLTVEQAAGELNVKSSLIRGLISSRELRAIEVGGRGLWRIGVNDVEDHIAEAYRRTNERIAAGEIVEDGEPDAGRSLQRIMSAASQRRRNGVAVPRINSVVSRCYGLASLVHNARYSVLKLVVGAETTLYYTVLIDVAAGGLDVSSATRMSPRRSTITGRRRGAN